MDVASLMAPLTQDLQSEEGEENTVEAIAAKAITMLPDAQCVSLTVPAGRGRHQTLVSTDPMAEKADAAQYALAEGPCLDAAHEVEWTRSGNVREDVRWPRWGPEANALGVGSLLSVALFAQSGRVGALNMYNDKPGRFADRDEVDLALIFAAHAGHALGTARLFAGLQTALVSRHEIGAAQGILMERFGLSLEQSFALLRRLSSHSNIKIAAIAHRIVETGELPDTGRPQD